jgi:hypothetical protein
MQALTTENVGCLRLASPVYNLNLPDYTSVLSDQQNVFSTSLWHVYKGPGDSYKHRDDDLPTKIINRTHIYSASAAQFQSLLLEESTGILCRAQIRGVVRYDGSRHSAAPPGHRRQPSGS